MELLCQCHYKFLRHVQPKWYGSQCLNGFCNFQYIYGLWHYVFHIDLYEICVCVCVYAFLHFLISCVHAFPHFHFMYACFSTLSFQKQTPHFNNLKQKPKVSVGFFQLYSYTARQKLESQLLEKPSVLASLVPETHTPTLSLKYMWTSIRHSEHKLALSAAILTVQLQYSITKIVFCTTLS